MKFNQKSLEKYYTTKASYMTICSSDLICSQDYQREIKPSHVNDIIANFNPYLMDDVLVSCRGGHYYVIDGQNRISALIQMNGGQPVMVKCKVFFDLTDAREADIFAVLDKLRRKLTPFEAQNALVCGSNKESEKARAFRDCCERLGVIITQGRSKNPKQFECMSTLYKAYVKYGERAFCRVIDLIVSTWPGNWDAKSVGFVNAMFKFDERSRGKCRREHFVSACQHETPATLVANAHSMRGSTVDCIRDFLTNSYNRGVREDSRI